MRPWSVFFSIITMVIVTTMVVPRVFGLQSFTQWGGMYVNGWCTALLSSDAPWAAGVQTESVTAGTTRTSPVWSAPQYNLGTCALWARSLCDKRSHAGWQVKWARPYFRDSYFLGSHVNVCAVPLPPDYSWFSDVP